MRPIRVLSLFDGMSCGQIALRELGVPIAKYYASEVDKFAIQQTQLNFPGTVQLGDVRNIDVDKLCEEVGEFDLLLAGSPCFAAGTKVLTSEGYKNIENVRIGDYVLTHQNRYRKVLKIGGKEAMTYKLMASGFVDTVCTANHPFYARKKQSIAYIQPNGKKSYKIQAGEPEWIEAQHLGKQYYVAHNIEQQESSNPLNITEEEAWVIGRYIADGHTRKDLRYDYQKDGSRGHNGSRAWQLILSIGNNKVDQVKSHFKDLHYSCYPHGDSVHRFVFSNKRLVQIVEAECGCGAINKHFGEHLIRLPRHLLEIVLQSYLEGDGYLQKNGRYSITTISRMLPITIQRVISKLYGRHINVTYHVPQEYRELCGRIIHQMPQYTIKFSIHPSKGVEKSKRIGDKMWRNIKAFEPVGEQKVFNLEVEEDNSYTANNLIVHNCQSFSFAGKRVGMKTKENIEILTLDQYLDLKEADFEFEGQSYLFWEFMRVLTALRRRNPNIMFLLENVEMGKKWETVLSNAIGIHGVHINSALVSAQNRKRIYWSNIRVREEGLFGYRYTDIPQPTDRGIILKDILESEVEEKYYLKDEVVQKLLEHKERHKEAGHGFGAVFHDTDGKMGAVKVGGSGVDNLVEVPICVAMRGGNPENPSSRNEGVKTVQVLEPAEEGKTNCLTSVAKDNLIAYVFSDGQVCLNKKRNELGRQIRKEYEAGKVNARRSDLVDYAPREDDKTGTITTVQSDNLILSNNHLQKNLTDVDNKANAFLATSHKGAWANDMSLVGDGFRIRRITPTECARLQTIPDWYKWECSATQQYRLLGNGWTVEVIKHIFSFMRLEDTV